MEDRKEGLEKWRSGKPLFNLSSAEWVRLGKWCKGGVKKGRLGGGDSGLRSFDLELIAQFED